MATNMRRLQRDHSALHKALPPYFFFPETSSSSDLYTLEIYLVGPPSTPYSSGVFKLLLRIPAEYPSSPPTAIFRTKIFHPNVDESTGSVCVDTLKRDWTSSLTLRDILITISCLLIYPNPDSALNAHAGQLIQDDFEEFKRYAQMMTSIHAKVPSDLLGPAAQARTRGEERGIVPVQSEIMDRDMLDTSSSSSSSNTKDNDSDSDEEDNQKENTPPSDLLVLQHPTPIPIRRPLLGKRPLSDLPPPIDPDELLADSARNISANSNRSLPVHLQSSHSASASPPIYSTGALRSPNLSSGLYKMGISHSHSRASSRSMTGVQGKDTACGFARPATLVERIRGGNTSTSSSTGTASSEHELVCKKRRDAGKENEDYEAHEGMEFDGESDLVRPRLHALQMSSFESTSGTDTDGSVTGLVLGGTLRTAAGPSRPASMMMRNVSVSSVSSGSAMKSSGMSVKAKVRMGLKRL